MDTIRSTAVSLCATLVVTGIFSMLLPEGGWNRYARFAVRLFLLLSLVLPFAGGDFRLDLESGSSWEEPAGNAGEMEALAEEQLLRNFAANLELAGEQALEEAGIPFQKIEVTVHIADEQRIDISELNITLPEEEKSRGDQASGLIKEAFGVEPRLAFSGQTGGKNSGE